VAEKPRSHENVKDKHTKCDKTKEEQDGMRKCDREFYRRDGPIL
jgi:hypothetical protein